jgi:hypothetical protein
LKFVRAVDMIWLTTALSASLQVLSSPPDDVPQADSTDVVMTRVASHEATAREWGLMSRPR